MVDAPSPGEPEDVVFRPATARDVAGVMALLADDDLGRGREAPDLASAQRAFATIETDPNNEIWVGERGRDVVACLQLTFIPGLSRGGAWRAQVEAVRVARRLRGGKIGAALMRRAEARALERGAALVQLTSDVRRSDAHRFYRRLGYLASHLGFKKTPGG